MLKQEKAIREIAYIETSGGRMEEKNRFLDAITERIIGNDELYISQTLDCIERFRSLARDKDSKKMQAVVGFDAEGKPRFWDMTKGNLFMHSATGDSVEDCGAMAIFVSLASRFSNEEVCYWFIANQSDNLFEEARRYCKEYVRYQCNPCRYKLIKSCFHLQRELERRATLSYAELENEPFLLVIFETPTLILPKTEYVKTMTDILFERGKDLKCACLLLSNRGKIEEIYKNYKSTFVCEWTGLRELGGDTAKEPWRIVDETFAPFNGKYHVFGIFSSDDKNEILRSPNLSLGLALRDTEYSAGFYIKPIV